MRRLFLGTFLLALAAPGSFGSVFLSISTESPNEFCQFNIATQAVNCVSDSGIEGRAAISASPTADGVGFTFTETFDMGPEPFQSFGNVELRAYDLVTYSGGAGALPLSYTETALEHGTCTSNVVEACNGFQFAFSEAYPPDPVGIFTSSPGLQSLTRPFLEYSYAYEVYFFLNHTTVANEHTSISGSVQIESVTFTSVPEPTNGQLVLMGLIAAGCWISLRKWRG